jgi:hypothetical protein
VRGREAESGVSHGQPNGSVSNSDSDSNSNVAISVRSVYLRSMLSQPPTPNPSPAHQFGVEAFESGGTVTKKYHW